MNRLSLLVLLSVIFVSCGNLYEDEKVSQNEQKTYPTLIASFADDETRTFIDGNLRMCWHRHDVVSAFVGSTKNNMYAFYGETGDTSGELTFIENPYTEEGTPLTNIYAVYPFDYETYISEDGVISCLVKEEQLYAENSFGKEANLMVAATMDTEDTSLSFKNVCGYLKLQLYGDATISKIELWGNDGEKIAGKATVVAKYGEAPQITMDSASKKRLSLICYPEIALCNNADSPTEFWFVVPPTTFDKGITIVVTDNNGCKFIKKTDKTINIKRNEILPMAKVNLNEEFKPLADVEREALVALYNALDGDNWADNTNWCSDLPLNEWYGVVTNSEGYVMILNLENNLLKGDVPVDIVNLSQLEQLTLRYNEISGVPSQINSLPILRCLSLPAMSDLPLEAILSMSSIIDLDLDLTKTNLEGYELKFDSFSNMYNLWISVNKNDLVELPKDFSCLEDIHSLVLYGFSGTIDPSIGECKTLTSIIMSRGTISGNIPSSIGNLNLYSLNLSYNQLTGSIPAEIGNCEHLYMLDLSCNQLTGTIPSELVNLFDNSDSYYEFSLGSYYLHHNLLSGDIPDAIKNHQYWCCFWPDMLIHNLYAIDELGLPGPHLSGCDVYGNSIDSTQEYANHDYTLILNLPSDAPSNAEFNIAFMKEIYNKYNGINILHIWGEYDTAQRIQQHGLYADLPWRLFTGNRNETNRIDINYGSDTGYMHTLTWDDNGDGILDTYRGNQVTIIDRNGNVVFTSFELNIGYEEKLCKFLEEHLGYMDSEI